jgi:hypothetical protein
VISASTFGTRFHLSAGSLERIFETALSPSAPYRINLTAGALGCNTSALQLVTPLPEDFLQLLEDHEEVLVTSRDGTTRGTVPVWFIIAPPGVVYLFGFGFSEKARRWRSDPWVRLRVPGQQDSVEGVAHFVGPDELDAIAPRIVERWAMQGAPTVDGLRRTLRDGVHVLVRIEGQPSA